MPADEHCLALTELLQACSSALCKERASTPSKGPGLHLPPPLEALKQETFTGSSSTQESVDVRELAGQIASGATPCKDGVEPRPEKIHSLQEGNSSGIKGTDRGRVPNSGAECKGGSGKDSEADMVGEQRGE